MSDNEVRQIAIYGKGGIGKSTICCNISAALAEDGLKVFQLGCSPKIDSTAFLNRGHIVYPSILDALRRGSGFSSGALQECFITGYKGVICAESGGPEPATGCAGKGVTMALDLGRRLGVLQQMGIDFAVYDVLGDVVCGGFAQPMRAGFANEVYIITSGELMSLYAANNICRALKIFTDSKQSKVRLGGIINNMRGVEKEEELVEEFCQKIGIPCLGHVPRSRTVQEAERGGGTVIEKCPDSSQAKVYRELAQRVLDNTERGIPSPIELEDITALLRKYQYEDKGADKGKGSAKKSVYPGGVPQSIAKPKLKGGEAGTLRKIAFYGKGGIGKSTVSSNVSAALSHMGEAVMQVGCDPKRDSISTLCGRLMPTVLDELATMSVVASEDLQKVVHRGYGGVLGVESGGPKPGVGCGGGAVMAALKLLEEQNVFERYGISLAIFDVLGDVVCGGFAQPMRAGYAREVYIVTCGEPLTLYQINMIAKSVKKLHDEGADCACAGIINNMRGLANEEKIVEEVAELMGLPVIIHIPRSGTVQDAELLGQTVIQAYPDSAQAEVYRTLAQRILDNREVYVPNPITLDEIVPIIDKYTGREEDKAVGQVAS